MIYSNETKIKDILESHLKVEIESLLKTVMMDFGSIMTQDMFSHTVNRLVYLINMKYKGLMIGEIKYVFEMAPEKIKGKLSVQTIMQLFYQYYDAKIEKQKQVVDSREHENYMSSVDCMKLPFGKAIIWKREQYELTGKHSDIPLKEVAEKISSGEIKFTYTPGKAKRVIGIEQ